MWGAGNSAADILRQAARSRPGAGPVDLMHLLEQTFGVHHDDVQCIGGWWHDGTGELDDERINGFIAPAIERALAGRSNGQGR